MAEQAQQRLTVEQALGLAARCAQARQLPQAEQIYRQILAAQPDQPDALFGLGMVAAQVGQMDVAAEHFARAAALRPDNADAQIGLGNALAGTGRWEAAVAAYRRAIALSPNIAGVHTNLGNALKELKRFDEAGAAHRQAIALEPANSYAHTNLGGALAAEGKWHEAIAAHRRAIELDPRNVTAQYNLGFSLRSAGMPDLAVAPLREAVALRPQFAKAHRELGLALKESGDLGQAIAACRRAVELEPDYLDGRRSLGMALLLNGELAEGWEQYESRFRCPDYAAAHRALPQPRWDGAAMASGTTLLLHAEQGLGDTLQFARYVPLVPGRGVGRVVLECQQELVRLLRQSLEGCEVVARGQALPAFEAHCPLLSLPRAFGTTLGTVPRDVPYLRADPAEVERWRQRLAGAGAEGAARTVGLVWAGSAAHLNDRNRSIALEQLAPLGRACGVRFVSLQKGPAAEQAKAPPPGMQLWDPMGEVNDLAETAALVANLDLVIGVDTAVVHLAGALGKPTWTLLPFVPDWRWLLGREDTPWYPTMRLFRQPPRGQWEPVIRQVAESLAQRRW